MDHVRYKPCSDREDRLHGLVAHAVAVKEVRLIRDKFTGQPRGFCFMEFHSVADAARALQLLQVLTPPPLSVSETSRFQNSPTRALTDSLVRAAKTFTNRIMLKPSDRYHHTGSCQH